MATERNILGLPGGGTPTPQPPQDPDSSPTIAQSYRPSTFIFAIVILLTLGSTFTSVLIPPFCLLFSIIIYGPTLHFAIAGVVKNIRGLSPTDSDVLKLSRKTRRLACIWVISMSLHVLFYFVAEDSGGLGGIFLVPTFAGIPATVLVLCIAVRCGMDAWWIQKEGRLRLRRDEERHNEPTIPSQSQIGETVNSSTALDRFATHTALIYQPGLPVLCLSILLAASKIVFQFTFYTVDNIGPEIFILFITFVYAPTIASQLYFIWRFKYGQEQTFEDGVKFGSWYFDLLCLWMVPQFVELMVLHFGKDEISGISKSSINFAEILVIGYIAMRYGRSVRREWKGIRENFAVVESTMIPGEQSSPRPGTAGSLEDIENGYQPSFILLIVYAGFSITCTVIETRASVVAGGPMSIFVYIPTAYMCLSMVTRRCFRSSYRYEKADERWQQLCALWILTQAFYSFVWPVSPYLRADVTQPWVRWPTVAISLYIAGRYWWDEHLKTKNGGAIRLPPDSDLEAGVPSVEGAEDVRL